MKNWNILLASQSPRRKQLLEMIDLSPTIIRVDVEEVYPADLPLSEVPLFLSQLKAKSAEAIHDDDLVITADTVVILENELLGKPKNMSEAHEMLQKLSAKTHQVITGVTLKSNRKIQSFSEVTRVTFQELTPSEITYYLSQYQPLDKAGSYGIQEWIGGIGMKNIEGCFYNVMGLPTSRLFQELKSF
jgi:septum formation protein